MKVSSMIQSNKQFFAKL